MKGIVSVALIGGVASTAAILLPGDAGQAWGPLAVLSTGVLLLAAWLVESDHAAPAAHTAPHERAA